MTIAHGAPTQRVSPRRTSIAWALLVALPLLTFGGILIERLDSQAQREVEAALHQRSALAIAAVDRVLADQLATLAALAEAPQLDRRDLADFRMLATRTFVNRYDWLTLRLVDAASGRVLIDLTDPTAEWGTAPPDRRSLEGDLDEPRDQIGNLRTDGALPEPYVEVRVPVVRNRGVRFVLSAAVRSRAFSDVLRDFAITEPWVAAVLDRDGVIVGRTRSEDRLVGMPAAESLLDAIARPGHEVFFGTTQDGEPVFGAYATSSYSGWTAAIGAPAHLIEAPRRRTMILSAAGGALALALAGAMVLVLSRAAAARRAAELRLQAERRLTDVAANFPGLIYRRVLHPDGRVSYPYSSSGFEDLFGLDVAAVSPAASLADIARRMVHPEDAARWLATLDASASRLEPYAIETRILHPRKGLRWLRSAARPHRGPDGSVVWDGVVTDVTEVRAAEEALRRSEERFRRLVEIGATGITVADHEGRITFANRTFLDAFGYSREDVALGELRWDRITPPEYREQDERALEELIRTGSCAPYEKVYLTRSGERVPVHVAASLIESGERPVHANFITDLRPLRALEAARRESEERLRLAVDASGFGTWDVDLLTERVIWSPRMKAIFGFAPDQEVTRAMYRARFHPDDRARIDAAIARALDPEGDGTYELEYRILRADGAVRWISVRGQTFFGVVDGARRAVRFLGAVVDSTERREAEEALRSALADKDTLLAQKDTLLREVHHRVKNNLQVVLTLLQFETATIGREADARARIQAVSDRIHAMAQLHEQLYGSENLARVELGRYVAALADHLAGIHAGQPVTIEVEADDVLCDPELAVPLGLLTNELVTNGLKHAFPDGRSGRIRVALRLCGDGLELTVSDDGVGAAASPRGSGGIGRLLIEALVQQIGGTMRVEDGDGTRTTVTVPDPERLGLVRLADAC